MNLVTEETEGIFKNNVAVCSVEWESWLSGAMVNAANSAFVLCPAVSEVLRWFICAGLFYVGKHRVGSCIRIPQDGDADNLFIFATAQGCCFQGDTQVTWFLPFFHCIHFELLIFVGHWPLFCRIPGSKNSSHVSVAIKIGVSLSREEWGLDPSILHHLAGL